MAPNDYRLVAAIPTPFTSDLTIDFSSFLDHARRLLAAGLDGVAILATVGEGPSLSIHERIAAIDVIAAGGITGDRLVVASEACNVEDGATLCREAIAAGASAALIVPPYYYRNVTAEGVARFYAELVERVGDHRLRIIFYHIPQISGVPIEAGVVDRLRAAYPGTFVGYHDASGDWAHTEAWTARAAAGALAGAGAPAGAGALAGASALAVTANYETRAIEHRALGGSGCISGTLNYTAELALRVLGGTPLANGLVATHRLAHECAVLREFPAVSALKAALGVRYADARWRAVMPPLQPLDDAAVDRLTAALAADHAEAGVPAASPLPARRRRPAPGG